MKSIQRCGVALLLVSVAACNGRHDPLAGCLTDDETLPVDRNGDGVIRPDDLDPGVSAVVLVLDDRATGENIATISSRSRSDRLVRLAGTPAFRPWMGAWSSPPSWNLLHSMEDSPCRTPPNVQASLQRTDDDQGVLREGTYAVSGAHVSVDETWTTEAFDAEADVVISSIDPVGLVSGYLDGVAQGVLFDGLLREDTDIRATLQGFAWRDIPGEHLP